MSPNDQQKVLGMPVSKCLCHLAKCLALGTPVLRLDGSRQWPLATPVLIVAFLLTVSNHQGQPA